MIAKIRSKLTKPSYRQLGGGGPKIGRHRFAYPLARNLAPLPLRWVARLKLPLTLKV
jgi:hypothetical protein